MISLLRAAGTKCLAPALTHLGFRFQQSGPVCSLSWGGGTPGCCAVLAPGASGAARSRGRGAECLRGPGSAQGPPPGPRPPRPPLGIEAASLAQPQHPRPLHRLAPLAPPGGSRKAASLASAQSGTPASGSPWEGKGKGLPILPARITAQGWCAALRPARATLSFPPLPQSSLDPRQAQHCSPYLSPGRERRSHGQSRRTVHSPAWQNGHFISGPYCPRLRWGDPGPATASPATRYRNIVPR